MIYLREAFCFYGRYLLNFTCTPKGNFLDLKVDGKKISFAENVFYQFKEGKIEMVWSVVDKVAIEKQLK